MSCATSGALALALSLSLSLYLSLSLSLSLSSKGAQDSLARTCFIHLLSKERKQDVHKIVKLLLDLQTRDGQNASTK